MTTPRNFSLAIATPTLLLALFSAPWAAADVTAPEHRLGDHPAVVVQRLQKSAGYDYASKFYPHPAWLYLSSEPREEDVAQTPSGDGSGARSTLASRGQSPRAHSRFF